MEAIDRNNSIFNVNSGRAEFDGFKGKQTRPERIKIPETADSFTRKTEEKQGNGKFSFLRFGKNVVKGTGLFFVDIYNSIVKNPLISIPLIAVGAAVASTPIGLAILAGCGVWGAAIGTIIVGAKMGWNAYKKRWNEVENQGIELGKVISGGALSTIGAVKAVRQLEKAAEVTSHSSVGRSVLKAGDLSMYTVNMMKNVVMAPIRAFNRNIRKHNVDTFMGTMKTDWGKFVNGENTRTFLNGFVNPNLNKGMFTKGEIDVLAKATSKPWSQAGFLDYTLGFRKSKTAGDFVVAGAEALKQV